MKNNNNGALHCPQCGSRVKLPLLWRLGVEIVFACGECRMRFKTGYKMGALLSALSLTAALVVANLLIFLFSSLSIPLVTLLIIPVWVCIGYRLRLWWLKRRYLRVKKSV